jgi:hypothetical protein
VIASRTGLAFALLLSASACMRAAPGPGAIAAAPAADSATTLLWRMDENGGPDVGDSGVHGLDGTAGQDTGVEFGRYGNARVFTESIESFVYLPYDPALDTPHSLTVEAWIYVREFGNFEDTPIAGRWTELANEQSWLFSIVGAQVDFPLANYQSPGHHRSLAILGTRGHLMFSLQPEEAGPPETFFSTHTLELERWTHVAATYDRQVVRFYVDGRLDSQFAHGGRIRLTRAPLLVGNSFDTRWLTDFGGSVRVGGSADRTPYYAFRGSIDELRISGVARTDFGRAAR